jgi:hypothetical protein
MNDIPEPTLITKSISGDSTAFGELVRRNQNDVFNVCYRLTANR